ncbi:urea ABC transporter permease subunit UrtC [Billgrantia endophytica]|uniref:Urea ABC transporter permease subunit UrtC n=1 Tax=Billgrantia endophytica TaxID=2033802 RepID=A0A2N7U5Q4_9GAMM|nr:urea ABC transporter permease subunit UrtC [Halomonas endophytica]PMR75760.1 urea ABC transporter permease subunit UrtC [Halomonas endophytica]
MIKLPGFLHGRHGGLAGILILAAILMIVMPAMLDLYRLNLAGRYLTYAFVAVGLVLCWGYGGILSLGQGIFFGVGGYAMAMFLKLEASDPESTRIQTTPGIPDFMDWNRITELPWFWVPFNSLTFTIIAVLVLPAAFAFVIGYAMFKRRVSGVYFAIITQALAVVLTILIVGQQGYTGGINGITDLRTLKGWDIRDDSAQYLLYYLNATLLIGCVLLGRWVLNGKYGRILTALRDREDRVRFSGYDVANFKVFIFCLAAFMSGIGGAMFTLQVGFMSPSFVGIVPSIEFVIFAAVGGRLSLLGGVYGALLVSYAKTMFAEAYPQLWQVMIGAVFILVVLVLPYGLASVYQRYGKRAVAKLKGSRHPGDTPTPPAASVVPGARRDATAKAGSALPHDSVTEGRP